MGKGVKNKDKIVASAILKTSQNDSALKRNINVHEFDAKDKYVADLLLTSIEMVSIKEKFDTVFIKHKFNRFELQYDSHKMFYIKDQDFLKVKKMKEL